MKLNFDIDTMSFYDRYAFNYMCASQEVRTATKEHYRRKHAENIRSGRKDLIVFTGQILEAIKAAETYMEKGRK